MGENTKVSENYTSIFKSASIFGGIQIINIVLNIVRSKGAAVLLGSTGMGINALFQNTIDLTRDITGLGIKQSAVKTIAQSGDESSNLGRVVVVFRILIWITSFLALFVAVVFGGLLSEWVFESDEYALQLRILGVVFVFGAVTSSWLTIFQGLRKVKLLALANVYSAVLGVTASIACYYFFGLSGIAPALILTALFRMAVSLIISRKVAIPRESVNFVQFKEITSELISLGVVMSATAFLLSGVKFGINAFIAKEGSASDLGYYNAGLTLVVANAGLIFTAMQKDYFPRISKAVKESGTQWRLIARQQTHLTYLALAVILVLLLTILPFAITILLTSEFQIIKQIVPLFALGLYLQGPTWSLGILIIAKNDLRIKIISEIIGASVLLGLSIWFYKLFDLLGLGIAFLATKFVSFIFTMILTRLRYMYIVQLKDFLYFFSGLLVLILMSGSIYYLNYPSTYLTGFVLSLITVFFVTRELQHEMDIRQKINRIFKRK